MAVLHINAKNDVFQCSVPDRDAISLAEHSIKHRWQVWEAGEGLSLRLRRCLLLVGWVRRGQCELSRLLGPPDEAPPWQVKKQLVAPRVSEAPPGQDTLPNSESQQQQKLHRMGNWLPDWNQDETDGKQHKMNKIRLDSAKMLEMTILQNYTNS